MTMKRPLRCHGRPARRVARPHGIHEIERLSVGAATWAIRGRRRVGPGRPRSPGSNWIDPRGADPAAPRARASWAGAPLSAALHPQVALARLQPGAALPGPQFAMAVARTPPQGPLRICLPQPMGQARPVTESAQPPHIWQSKNRPWRRVPPAPASGRNEARPPAVPEAPTRAPAGRPGIDPGQPLAWRAATSRATPSRQHRARGARILIEERTSEPHRHALETNGALQ